MQFQAIYILLMLGWLFVPVYVASGIYTIPEYMKKRFGGERIQMYLAVLSLLMYVFTKISVSILRYCIMNLYTGLEPSYAYVLYYI